MNLKKLVRSQKFSKKANGIIWGIIIFLCLLSIAGTIAFFVINGIPEEKQEQWMQLFRQYWVSFIAIINGIQAPLIIIKVFTTANQLAIQYKMRKVIGDEEKKMISFKKKQLAKAIHKQNNKKTMGKNLVLYNKIIEILTNEGLIFTEDQSIEIVSLLLKKETLGSLNAKIFEYTKKKLNDEAYFTIMEILKN